MISGNAIRRYLDDLTFEAKPLQAIFCQSIMELSHLSKLLRASAASVTLLQTSISSLPSCLLQEEINKQADVYA